MRSIRRIGGFAFALVLAYLVMIFALRIFAREPEGPHPLPEEATSVFDPGDYDQRLGRDDILPVYDPFFRPAEDSALDDTELVMGVAFEGEARAYPVGFLNLREMVIDEIGPVQFLVTW